MLDRNMFGGFDNIVNSLNQLFWQLPTKFKNLLLKIFFKRLSR